MTYRQNHLKYILFMAIASTLKLLLFNNLSATAQIIPDNTLGAESSQVIINNNPPPLNRDQPSQAPIQNSVSIEGGAARGGNLFHSFADFNVNNNQLVNFSSTPNITNILTRVTGSNPSNILGTLQVGGDANLFLINPNGIIFRSGANIDLNGSFFAATGDRLNFDDGSTFSAVNPEAPPLLTISQPIGLQLGQNPGEITAQQARIAAQNIDLIGGEINLQQTVINAPGGDIWLGSFRDGAVSFTEDLADELVRGDINFSQQSIIDVLAAGGGNIAIAANNLTITDSEFLGGIGEDLGSADATAGNIDLDAVGDIVLDNSNINNNLELNSIGNSGEIVIDARNLLLNNSRIVSDTKSTGNAGNIRVSVIEKLENISNLKNSANLSPRIARKGLFSFVNAEASGHGGNIKIVSPEISLSGLGGIDSSTVGIGNAGTIEIQSDRLTIEEGAGVFANGRGIGDGGEIFIKATEFIEISDRQVPHSTPDGKLLPGGIIAGVGRGNLSNGGSIEIATGRLSVTKGAIITTDTKGVGNGGDINITARDLVEVVGHNEGSFPSQIVAAVRENATGNGGKIEIATKDLSIRDGATINVGTRSDGNSGNLSVTATGKIELAGTSRIGTPSSLLAQVGTDAAGKGGDIIISAQNLRLAGGGQISASTLGTGEGGSVTTRVEDEIVISGYAVLRELPSHSRFVSFIKDPSATVFPSGIYASSPGLGNADALDISAGSLSLSDRAQLSVSSQQQGAAGNLTVNAKDLSLDRGIISAETIEGDRANIMLDTDNLRLSNNSLITTNAREAATGGNIAIDTDILLALDNSDITANAVDNFGGQVFIEAQGIFGIQARETATPQSDITATSRLGAEFSGIVEIDLDSADPASGTLKLPENFIDATQQIISSCRGNRDNSFIVTGRGGITTSPQETLRGQTILQDWRLSTNNEQLTTDSEYSSIESDLQKEIIEAKKAIVNPNGKVQLVADTPQMNLSPWLSTMQCNS